MKKILNVNEVAKGDKIFVKDIAVMWDGNKNEFYNHCFEYVFEVIKNNPKTLGCKHINGPHKNSGFSWIKGYDLVNNKKQYFLLEDEEQITENNYRM